MEEFQVRAFYAPQCPQFRSWIQEYSFVLELKQMRMTNIHGHCSANQLQTDDQKYQDVYYLLSRGILITQTSTHFVNKSYYHQWYLFPKWVTQFLANDDISLF